MINKPYFWLIPAGINLTFWGIANITEVPMEFKYHCEDLFWFSIAVFAILLKLNQLGTRLENSAKLQTAAFRTLRK